MAHQFHRIIGVSQHASFPSDKPRILIGVLSIVHFGVTEQQQKLELLKDIGGYTESIRYLHWVWDKSCRSRGMEKESIL